MRTEAKQRTERFIPFVRSIINDWISQDIRSLIRIASSGRDKSNRPFLLPTYFTSNKKIEKLI